MANKVVREKSRCDNCIADKLRFLKQKSNKKTGWININSKRFICQPLQSMLTNYLKCINDTESVDPRLLKKKYGRTILSSKCAICGSKKSRFMKE